jgi:hypothetical protein
VILAKTTATSVPLATTKGLATIAAPAAPATQGQAANASTRMVAQTIRATLAWHALTLSLLGTGMCVENALMASTVTENRVMILTTASAIHVERTATAQTPA